jgi:hypothetical protein
MKTYTLTIKGSSESFEYVINTFGTINSGSRTEVTEAYMCQFGSRSSNWVIEQIALGNYNLIEK